MAIINRVDAAAAQRNLQSWFTQRYPDRDVLQVGEVTSPTGNGRSSETLLLDVQWMEGGTPRSESFVARVEPADEKVVYTYDLESECRVMRAVGEWSSVPVPRVLTVEHDPSVLGNTFLLMERLYGRTLADEPPFPVDPNSWVHSLSAPERTRLFDNALAVLVEIHAVDVVEAGLSGIARTDLGTDLVDQNLEYWRRFLTWGMKGEPNPTVDATLEWLEANRPTAAGPAVLNWGDSRLGNIMFGEDLSVTGVLDWELATIGFPGFDLGWWLFADRHHSEGLGAPWPDGFPSRERVLERYVELGGVAIVDPEWHEAFGGLRFAVLMARAGNMLVDAGLLPAGHTMALNNPATQLLSRMLDVPSPLGESTSFLAG
jgi:aminoglycoside phosphotransferase (APT) family kinase protein